MRDKGFQWQDEAAVCKKYNSTKQGCLPLLASASVITNRAVSFQSLGCRNVRPLLFTGLRKPSMECFSLPPRYPRTETCLTQKNSSWHFDVLCSLEQTWGWWLRDCQPFVCRKAPVHKLKKTWCHQQSNVALMLSPCAGTDMPVESEGMRVGNAWALLATKIMRC